MYRLKRATVWALAFALAAMPVLQPIAAYADTPGIELSDEGSTGEGAAPVAEVETDDAVEDDAEAAPAGDGAEAEPAEAAPESAAPQAAEGDAAAAADTAEPAADEEVGESDLVANSWRYENGEPRTDLDAPAINALSRAAGPEGATAHGIDVSEWQGAIDWERVKASGIDFAIIRIGFGDAQAGRLDKQWKRNVAECERLGIPWGAYLYSYATDTTDAANEAAHALSALAGHTPELPVYLDLEDNSTLGSDFTAIAKTFCSRIASAGYAPGVYANLDWWNSYLGDAAFDGWDRWVAQWGNECTYEGGFSLWQATSNATVPGIDGSVDMNYRFEPAASTESAKPAQKLSAIDQLAADHANDLPDGTYRFSSALNGGRVIDVRYAGTANGTAVQLFDFNDTSAQTWRVTHDGNYVVLTSASSNKVLDVAGASTKSGTKVQLYSSNGTKAQRWVAVKGSDGTIELISALGAKVALDLPAADAQNGNQLQVYTRNATKAQKWNVVDVTAAEARMASLAKQYRSAVADGEYAILNGSTANRKALDVSAASTKNGANVQIYDSNGTGAQRWKVTHDKDGYVTLTCKATGKVLDVDSAVGVSGRNVWQYASNGTKAQKWVIVPESDGTYRIVSALWPELVLDVSAASTKNGANVQIYTANGTSAQKWSFVSTAVSVAKCDDILPKGTYGELRASSSSGLVADVTDASTDAGARLQLYSANGTFAQLFCFEYENGYYRIVNLKSGKAVAVDNGDVVAGASIVQVAKKSGDGAQLFSVTRNDDGSYTFVNKATGLALSFTGSAASGRALVSAKPDGSARQRFTFDARTELLDEGVYALRLSSSSMALDVAGASSADSAAIQLYSPNGTLAQSWLVSKVAGKTNTYTFECLCSGKRLTMDSKGAVSQRAASSSASQQWIPAYTSGGMVLKNAAYPSYVLTASKASSGAKIAGAAAGNSGLQSFDVKEAGATLPDGTYVIHAAANSGIVLDVSAGATGDGANVQVYASNGSGAQKWRVSRNSDGTYRIANARSGKLLDVKDARAVSGANVQQWGSNGSTAQKWRISYASGGWKITSALSSSLVLDISGGAAKSGANLQVYTDNGSSAQRFTFTTTSYTQEYIGFQNPSRYYQVSHLSVTIPHMGQGIFGYRTESRIPYNATKQDCINAMISRAYDYVGSPYKWDYSCAPGVGVDCAGLVMQCLYATGMDLKPFTPWDHYYTPGHDHYANDMWASSKFLHLSFSQRQRGDLVCYPGHIAIYIGNDKIIEAYNPRYGVRISSVYSTSGIKGVLRPFV